MSSDPFDGDPYRSAGSPEARQSVAEAAACPRCAGQMSPYFRVLVCRSGCGIWLPAAAVLEIATFEELDACGLDVGTPDLPAPRASCPVCPRLMTIRRHGSVVFDVCPGHGVWLDRGERTDFEQGFADQHEELRWLGDARARVETALRRERAWFDAAWLARARPSDGPRDDGAAESEEQAWLAGGRARLDDERG